MELVKARGAGVQQAKAVLPPGYLKMWLDGAVDSEAVSDNPHGIEYVIELLPVGHEGAGVDS